MTGIELIAAERQEQIEKHGWNLEHDTQHTTGQLSKVAAVLATYHTDASVDDPLGFGSYEDPWGLEHKYKDNHVKALQVAGALIAAEIDRLKSISK